MFIKIKHANVSVLIVMLVMIIKFTMNVEVECSLSPCIFSSSISIDLELVLPLVSVHHITVQVWSLPWQPAPYGRVLTICIVSFTLSGVCLVSKLSSCRDPCDSGSITRSQALEVKVFICGDSINVLTVTVLYCGYG